MYTKEGWGNTLKKIAQIVGLVAFIQCILNLPDNSRDIHSEKSKKDTTPVFWCVYSKAGIGPGG